MSIALFTMLKRLRRYRMKDLKKWPRVFATPCTSVIILICFLIFLISCETVPITGRQRLSIIPESDLLPLSLQQYSEVLKKSQVSHDPGKVMMVKNAGNKIARASEAFLRESGRGQAVNDYKWEFNVINDDKVVNAWCMPGGKVAVYTGIFPITRDETGMAVVLSHEIAHAIAGHGSERMSEALVAQLGGAALSTALQTHPGTTSAIFMQVYGVGASVGYLLPHSRLQESEADRIGLMLMARAGYNPEKAVDLWVRMSQQGKGSRPPEFLSTHPAPETRIAEIKTCIPEAMSYYQGPRQTK
jgi:predicted Zn-dependent protease